MEGIPEIALDIYPRRSQPPLFYAIRLHLSIQLTCQQQTGNTWLIISQGITPEDNHRTKRRCKGLLHITEAVVSLSFYFSVRLSSLLLCYRTRMPWRSLSISLVQVLLLGSSIEDLGAATCGYSEQLNVQLISH